MEVTAAGPSGHPLVPEEVAGGDDVAGRHDDLPEVGVDAPVVVAVIDNDHDWQARPEGLRIEPLPVGGQVAGPTHVVVVVAPGGQHDPTVGGRDRVPAARREVDAVMDVDPILDLRAPAARSEGQGQARVGERPHVAGQGGRIRRQATGPGPVIAARIRSCGEALAGCRSSRGGVEAGRRGRRREGAEDLAGRQRGGPQEARRQKQQGQARRRGPREEPDGGTPGTRTFGGRGDGHGRRV